MFRLTKSRSQVRVLIMSARTQRTVGVVLGLMLCFGVAGCDVESLVPMVAAGESEGIKVGAAKHYGFTVGRVVDPILDDKLLTGRVVFGGGLQPLDRPTGE